MLQFLFRTATARQLPAPTRLSQGRRNGGCCGVGWWVLGVWGANSSQRYSGPTIFFGYGMGYIMIYIYNYHAFTDIDMGNNQQHGGLSKFGIYVQVVTTLRDGYDKTFIATGEHGLCPCCGCEMMVKNGRTMGFGGKLWQLWTKLSNQRLAGHLWMF